MLSESLIVNSVLLNGQKKHYKFTFFFRQIKTNNKTPQKLVFQIEKLNNRQKSNKLTVV